MIQELGRLIENMITEPSLWPLQEEWTTRPPHDTTPFWGYDGLSQEA